MAEAKTVRAYAKGIDQTPRKVSLVASLVRGRSVDDAVVILSHTPKRAAKPVKKTIESARANAINNHNLEGKSLIISTMSVTSDKRMKRYKANAMGRPMRFQKRSSNILVEVVGNEKPKKQTKPPVNKENK
jgi:large subunit ribosomal protein L22